MVGNPEDRFSHVTAKITSGLAGNLRIILSGLWLGVHAKEIISYFSTKTYVVGTQQNRLNETVLLSTQNIC